MSKQSLIVAVLGGTLGIPVAVAQERQPAGSETTDPAKMDERAGKKAERLENQAEKVRDKADRKAERVEEKSQEQADKVRARAEQKAEKIENQADRLREAGDKRTETQRTETQRTGTQRPEMQQTETQRTETQRTGDETAAPAAPRGAAAEAKEELSDTWLTTKVKTAFTAAEGLENSDISVDTDRNGVVTLTGTVPTTAARERASSVAKGIDGVRKVNNQLKIVRTPRAE